jgi:glycosyltransferase involved in cell wall biosynthesis
VQPAVSIILPVFNRLKYLRSAVDSVLGQSFRDWELLIADDGSGPDTRDYLRSLHDGCRIRVLWLTHVGNPAAVRNAALREAKGDYIAFLDSDDLWLPGKLGTQISRLRSSRGCEWSYTGFDLVGDSGNRIHRPRVERPDLIGVRTLDQLVREQALIVTPSVVARRELLERAGGYNEQLLACEDYELWMRLASYAEAEFINEPLVLVRRHAEHSFDDITCLENLRRAIEIVKDSGTAPHLNATLNRRRASISANLARAQFIGGRRGHAVRTLLASAVYSWPYRVWWRGGLAALIRAFVPSPALRFIDTCRHGRASRPQP